MMARLWTLKALLTPVFHKDGLTTREGHAAARPGLGVRRPAGRRRPGLSLSH